MSSSRFYAGLFLVTLSTLMLQVVQTRILSVALWYHLAFFVISAAMFGLTAGAVWVYLRGERFTEKSLPGDLARYSAALAGVVALTLAVQMTLAPTFQRSLSFVVVWVELAIVISLPFFLSGVVVSLALTRSPFPIGRVYGVDMLGAATGCLAAVVVLHLTDGPSAALWVAATVALAAWLFARSGRPAETRPGSLGGRLLGRPGRLGLLLAACALANGATRHGLQPLYVKDRAEERGENLLYERWNSFSRVVAVTSTGGRMLYGPAPNRPSPRARVGLRSLTIDGQAATPMYEFDGDLQDVDFLKYDITNLAYYLPERERGAVIGVGGGRDVLAARVFGLSEVTGIEINPIFIELLTRDPDFAAFAGLRDLEGVRFVVDEARSWLARTNERFDVIQMSMIDTWAATGAGAFTLTENGLYTIEAWSLFLDRLADGGAFTVSRWYAPGDVNETGRMISLAVATLMKRGVGEPRRHLFAAATRQIATLVMSPTPFTETDRLALTTAADKLGFRILLSPTVDAESEILRGIVEAGGLDDLIRRTRSLDLDLSPPDDDRPFFFNQLPFHRPARVLRLASSGSRPPGVVAGNVQATATLLAIVLVSFGLVVMAILLPLRSAVRDVGRRVASAGTAYFVLIGIGFMMIEIGLLQRMSVFLGHPIYSLGVVLSSLILATGTGSLASDRFALSTPGRFVTWSVLTGVYVLAFPFWWPAGADAFASSPLLARIGFSVVALFPAGFLMGFGFPTGMRWISAVDRRPTPWLWGVNGAAGVLGSTLGLATSIALGISTTLTLGGICYLLLVPVVLSVGLQGEAQRRRARPAAGFSSRWHGMSTPGYDHASVCPSCPRSAGPTSWTSRWCPSSRGRFSHGSGARGRASRSWAPSS
jgi:hypothetical protein